MTAPRQPRQWNEGAYMPEDRCDVVDKRGVQWAWDCEEEAYAAYGRDEVCSWAKLFRLFGPLVEVLPETPEPVSVPVLPTYETYFHGEKLVQCGGCGKQVLQVLHSCKGIPAPQSSPAPLLPLSAPVETEGEVEGAAGDLRDQLADLLDAAFERNHTASLDSIEGWDFDADLLPTADAILAAGWRPPLPKMDVDSLRSRVGALIAEVAFHDDDRDTALAVAQALIDGGWLDRSGVFGAPEPVAHTLRRVIQDLENEAMFRDPVRMIGAYSERSADDVIGARALSEYADRLRKHPSLTGEPVAVPVEPKETK